MNLVTLIEDMNDILHRTRILLLSKNSSYNPNKFDCLNHFKEDAEDINAQLIDLFSYAKKHWKKLDALKSEVPTENTLSQWQESLDDLKNYCILAELLILDYLRGG